MSGSTVRMVVATDAAAAAASLHSQFQQSDSGRRRSPVRDVADIVTCARRNADSLNRASHIIALYY